MARPLSPQGGPCPLPYAAVQHICAGSSPVESKRPEVRTLSVLDREIGKSSKAFGCTAHLSRMQFYQRTMNHFGSGFLWNLRVQGDTLPWTAKLEGKAEPARALSPGGTRAPLVKHLNFAQLDYCSSRKREGSPRAYAPRKLAASAKRCGSSGSDNYYCVYVRGQAHPMTAIVSTQRVLRSFEDYIACPLR